MTARHLIVLLVVVILGMALLVLRNVAVTGPTEPSQPPTTCTTDADPTDGWTDVTLCG